MVRVAAPGDAEPAEAVSERAFRRVRDVYRPTDAAVAAKCGETSPWTRLVAERDGEIVATVEYRLAATRLTIRALAVEPSSQRQGIARQVVDALAGIARAEGRRTMSLFTIRETGNVRVFERLGFTVASEEIPRWCVSDAFNTLHETCMERQCG